MTVPLEKEVHQSVRRTLELFGFDVSSFAQGYRPGGRRHATTRQTKGIPDLYARSAILKARLWVEVKRPGGKLSEDQVAWHERERAAGGEVVVAHSGVEMAEYLARRIPEWRRQREWAPVDPAAKT